MGGRRLPKGESDRYGSGVACGCDPSAGAIVLFYAYVPLVDPAALVSRLRLACERGGHHGKIIMISARDSVDDIAEALEFGAVDYLVKPIDATQLLGKVRRHL